MFISPEETIYAIKVIREACVSRKNAVSCRNQLSLRIAHYAHEASACFIVVKVRGCDPAFCQRDHEIERPRRVAVAADEATWFEYRRCSLSETGSRRGIRDSYSTTHTVSAIGSRARHFPSRSRLSPPFSAHHTRFIRSLPKSPSH